MAHNQPTTHSHTCKIYIYIYFKYIPTHNKWWLVVVREDSNQKKRGTAATTSSLDAVRSPTGDGQWQPAPLNVAENSTNCSSSSNPHTHTGTKQCGLGLQQCSTSRFADDAVKKSPLARHLLAAEKQSMGNGHTKMLKLKCWGRSERNRLLCGPTHTNPRALFPLKQPTHRHRHKNHLANSCCCL